MGLLSLTYKRPSYVAKDDARLSQSSYGEQEKSSLRSGKSGVSAGIPDAVTFDKIISGGTCAPLTTRDFMNYLLYVECAAENLQFYLWYQDYVRRFKEASTTDLALAPEWTKAKEDKVAARLQKETTENVRRETIAGPQEIFKGTDFEKKPIDAGVADSNPFSTPPRTATSSLKDKDSIYSPASPTFPPPSPISVAHSYRFQAGDAFASAGARMPFTIQPFREEINRIISTYIMDGSPRQLNLSDRDRKAIVLALSYTTHPSALRTAFRAVDTSLRLQNHPNFVRWSVCNGNPARISFARSFGFSGIIMGFALATILTLSHVGRGWRALAAVFWVISICAVVASYRGMCICMYSMGHHRHIRPWELFIDAEEPNVAEKRSFESFGSTNSFETEPWVIKYSQQNLLKKIFDREAWIEEAALRTIQDTIFVQSLIVGLVAGGILTAIFVPLPSGNYF